MYNQGSAVSENKRVNLREFKLGKLSKRKRQRKTLHNIRCQNRHNNTPVRHKNSMESKDGSHVFITCNHVEKRVFSELCSSAKKSFLQNHLQQQKAGAADIFFQLYQFSHIFVEDVQPNFHSLRFANIYLCTALLTFCHSISIKLRSGLWAITTPELFSYPVILLEICCCACDHDPIECFQSTLVLRGIRGGLNGCMIPRSWECKTSLNPHSFTTTLDSWYEVFVAWLVQMHL